MQGQEKTQKLGKLRELVKHGVSIALSKSARNVLDSDHSTSTRRSPTSLFGKSSAEDLPIPEEKETSDSTALLRDRGKLFPI